jgi:cardiolipin synthase
MNPRVSALELPAVEPAGRIRLHLGGAQAFPHMLAGIAAARSAIELQVYLFRRDRIGGRFIAALSAAAARGVCVRVTLDGWGSAREGRAIAARLRAAGCEARIFNRLLTVLRCRFGRNHRKVLLIDDRLAFVGGANIGDEYAGEDWLDLVAEISGPVCAPLGRALRLGGRAEECGPIRIYLSGLLGGGRLRRRYLKAIRRARVSVLLAHGYFLPDAQLLRALGRAAARGVRIVALLAGRSDVPFAPLATRLLYGRLLEAGIEVHEWTSSFLHAKAAVIDGHKLLVGSFNLDPLSLAMMEILVEADDAVAASGAETWIRSLVARARLVKAEELRTASLQRWFLGACGRIFALPGEWLAAILLRRHRKPSSSSSRSASPGGVLRCPKRRPSTRLGPGG